MFSGAQKWKQEHKLPPKIKGACVKWDVKKGFGFLKRTDGLPDLYVHQRDVQKKGFRSLLEGEEVEFGVAAMDDGRLHAIRVTGPGGVDVKGMPNKRDQSDSEESDDDDAAGGASKGAKAGASADAAPVPVAKPKAALAFVPRVVARPKPPVKQKPKPPAPAAPPAPPP